MSGPKLYPVPCTVTRAKEVVEAWQIARRIGAALGYARMVTYTRADEPGASLRAAGMTDEGPIRARSWDMPGRRRTDKTEIIQRRRWALDLGETMDVVWPELAPPQRETLFDVIA